MSRLTELLAQVKSKDSILGEELDREFKLLATRRAFGLNFERHQPEHIELPNRPVRVGDNVRILPPRGSNEKGDRRLWRVRKVSSRNGRRLTQLTLVDVNEQQATEVYVEDLVVVAKSGEYIYPGLASTGRVERGAGKPYHVVINGENLHVLEALRYTHRGRIDAIYLDPPYNGRRKDWKYNNDYVDPDDFYHHSKWLAMMERRLKKARDLLRQEESLLLVTIDEKEVHRLALLLEQVFPDAAIQMVTNVISSKGAVRKGKFSRVEEHLFFVTLGRAAAKPWFRNMLDPVKNDVNDSHALEWLGLRRRSRYDKRGSRPNQFYPVFVHEKTGHLHSIGDAIDNDVDRKTVAVPNGTVALWPLKPDGTEMIWGLTPEALRRIWEKGYAKVNSWKSDEKTGTVKYLQSGTIEQIEKGRIIISGKKNDGSVVGRVSVDDDFLSPKRVWNLASHNAEFGGTKMLAKLVPGRDFPYPKSLYAVEDALRFYLADKPHAIVLDFFSGSGTTTHAVMRLNRQDGGRRISISVTNNEVSAEEETGLRDDGLRPGDPKWEKFGVCDFVTKPRIKAAITGITPDGTDVDGSYQYTDEFPMALGFEENAEFFTLTYESPIAVSHNLAFERISPLLWMRAGSIGKRIDALPQKGWAIAETYGLLSNLDLSRTFCEAVRENDSIRFAYIVTDDDRRFQSVARNLPDVVESVRVYESYLANFRFAIGR